MIVPFSLPSFGKKEMNEFLKIILMDIVDNDTNYGRRERMIYQALVFAQEVGYEIGFRIDPNESEWPVAYIELPSGQVSWHMPQHKKEWDGHTTQEKFERIKQFVNGAYNE